MRQNVSKIRIFCSIRQFNLVKITHSHAVKCLSSNNGNFKTFHKDFLYKQPTQNIAIINIFCKKILKEMFRKFIFLLLFKYFKYPQFVWSKNFTYDNSFIFHPQCHALASLFLNMPVAVSLSKHMLRLRKRYISMRYFF